MTRRPATVAELATVVRDAHELGTPLRIVGGGSWLGAGGAVTAGAERLELSELRGIVDYVPGDLTLTARSGTTLAEIDADERDSMNHGCSFEVWFTTRSISTRMLRLRASATMRSKSASDP